MSTLGRFEDGREIPEDVLDALLIYVELAYRDIVAQDSVCRLSDGQRQASECVRLAIKSFRDPRPKVHNVSV